MDAARARYYGLQKKAFVSLACTVRFNTATVPLLPMLGTPAQDCLKHPSKTGNSPRGPRLPAGRESHRAALLRRKRLAAHLQKMPKRLRLYPISAAGSHRAYA